MPNDSLRRVAGLPTSVGIAVLAVVVSAPFARLDFDPHHDGVMVAAAVAVRDGLVVQRDVFAQYGPVTPFLQGWFLKVGLDPTLGIRLLNVLVIGLVAFAIADLGRKMPSFWPVSLSAGRWASFAWIVLADYFLWVPQLPWSSVVAAALSGWALLFVGRAVASWSSAGGVAWRVPAAVAGVLVALLPFTRLNVGIVTATCSLFIAVIASSLFPQSRKFILWVGQVWVTSTAVLLIALIALGALVPWWHQAVIGPLSWATEVGNQLGPDILLRQVARTFWPALAAITIIVVWVSTKGSTSRRGDMWIASLSAFTSVGLLLSLYRNPGLDRIFLADQQGPRESFIDGLTRSSLVFLTLLVAVVLLVTVLQVGRISIWIARRRAFAGETLSWLTLIGFAVGGIIQFAPVPDSRHIWWGLPIGMALIFASFGRSRLWLPTRNPLALSLAAAGIAAVLSGVAYLGIDRVPGPEGSVAAGTFSREDVGARVIEATDVLSESVGEGKAVFLVQEGAWSVFDGRYHSPDCYFVGWVGMSSPPDQVSRLSMAEWVITDEIFTERDSESLEKFGFQPVSQGGGLTVWTRNLSCVPDC